MTWTLWGLAVQTVAGFFGADAAASAAHGHRFDFIGHSVTGLVGVALSSARQNPSITRGRRGCGAVIASVLI
jgi:hypothetical protein